MTAEQQRIGQAFRVRTYAGMGDARPITSAVGAGLMTTGGLLAATGVGVLPGAIVSAVGALTSLIGGLFTPNITNIQATHIVDDIEARVLKPTLASWQALSANQKTEAMRATYLAVVDNALANVAAGCSNPQLGDSGRRCISERVRGGRFPWPEWFRDPIANDPNVISDSVGGSVTGSIDSAVTGFSSSIGISPLWIGLGLVAFAFLAVSD